jgi:hypothetical protein
VEITPLPPADVADYLTASTAGPPTRWQPARDALRDDPYGPLAAALATPLMVWLARTMYRRTTTDPADLLRGALATDATAIQRHLLDGLVPALYRDPPDDGRRTRRWSATQAYRWLSYIARNLTNQANYDIDWWRLSRGVLPAFPTFDVGIGATLAAAYGLMFAGGLNAGRGDLARAGMLAALGLFVHVSPALGSFAMQGSFTGSRSYRFYRNAALLTGAVVAVLVGAAAQSAPISGHHYPPPQAVAHALIPGLLAGTTWSLLYSVWGRWAASHTLLALTRRLPWHLARFLNDARQCGALRQVGPVRQFRHALLQHRLANPDSTHRW